MAGNSKRPKKVFLICSLNPHAAAFPLGVTRAALGRKLLERAAASVRNSQHQQAHSVLPLKQKIKGQGNFTNEDDGDDGA